eukprot:RCo008224
MGNRAPLAALRYKRLGQALDSSNYAVAEELGGVENVIEQRRMLGRNVEMYEVQGYQYHGEMRDGMKHGAGILKFPGGGQYEGEWYGDTFEGKGRLTLPNGEVYEGFFRTGTAHGAGDYIFVDGTKLEGEWRLGLINGEGVVCYPDGKHILCNFRDGLGSGSGTITFPNGDRYTGEMQNAVMHGKGRYLLSDPEGDELRCSWSCGLPEGRGLRLAQGQWYSVEFADGICIRSIPTDSPSPVDTPGLVFANP